MCLPLLFGGVVHHAHGGEDRVPKCFHGVVHGKVGEDLLCPCFAGDGGDAPLILVVAHIAQGLDHLSLCGADVSQQIFVNALHGVGVIQQNVDLAGQFLVVEPLQFALPLGHAAEGLFLLIEVVQTLQLLIHVVDLHPCGTCFVAFFCHKASEGIAFHLRFDDSALTLLYICTRAGDEPCVGTQFILIHLEYPP